MSLKVNFEIIAVEPSNGTIEVKYWGDGISESEYNIGPFVIKLYPELEAMTNEELYLEIARWGIPMVEEQLRIKNTKDLGVNTRISSLVNTKVQANFYTAQEALSNSASII